MAINTGDGLFELLKIFLLLIFLITTCLFFNDEQKNIDIFIKGINISLLIFTGYALPQFYLVIKDALAIHHEIEIDFSLCSTLGNKNIYSEVLLLCLPFTIYGSLVFKNFWKILSSLNIVIILLTAIILQTVYVWIAFLISILVSLLFIIRFRNILSYHYFVSKYSRTKVITAIIVFGFIFTTILYFSAFKTSNFTSLKNKITTAIHYYHAPEMLSKTDFDNNFLNENNNNINERSLLTKNSLRMIKDHLILGVGLSNWKIIIPKYGQVSISDIVRNQHPHNDYLWVWSETGIAGLLFYVLIFIIPLRYAVKIIKSSPNKEDKWLALLMLFGITGFMIISFFSFTKERIFPMILVMTMIAVLLSKYNSLFPFRSSVPKNIFRTIIVFFILISCVSIVLGCKRIIGEIHLRKALQAQQEHNWKKMIQEIDKSYSYFFPIDFTSTPPYWYRGFANYYSKNLDNAFEDFKKAEKVNPYHIQLLNDIGTCYELKGDHSNAIKYYQRALNIHATFHDALLNLCAAYFNSGQIEEASNMIDSGKVKNRDFLIAVLSAKANKISSSQENLPVKNYLANKIKDSNWLLDIYSKVETDHTSFENKLIEEAEKQFSK